MIVGVAVIKRDDHEIGAQIATRSHGLESVREALHGVVPTESGQMLGETPRARCQIVLG